MRPSGAPLPFFPVATHKFIVLSVCSFGIYQLYWSYQNWKRIRSATGEDLSPFWRAFFAPLWNFSLFHRIRDRATLDRVVVAWRPEILGGAYLALHALWRLPKPWKIIGLAAILPMLPVQRVTRRVNELHGSSEDPNTSYSRANVLTIVFGILLLLLAIAGAFLSEELPNPPLQTARHG